jgi:MFS1 family protein
LFLLAASMIQASHALYYTFGTLHWRAQGFADGTIGALWALGVLAEIGLFAVSGPRPLYRALSGEAYAVMALLALAGAGSAVFLMRRWRGERVVGAIQVQPQSPGGGGMTMPEL